MRGRRGAAALIAAVTVLTGCSADDPAAPSPSESEQPVASAFAACPEQPDEPAAGGSAVPPLAFDCLGGGSLDLTRAPGVPTVVNLWGSWCPPCRDELPLLQELADTAGDRVRVVGVVSKDGEPQAESFGEDAGVTFPNAFDGAGDLMAELVPKKEWTDFSHRVIFHGRRVCHAKKPACGACGLAAWCPSFGVGPLDPEAAAKLVKSPAASDTE